MIIATAPTIKLYLRNNGPSEQWTFGKASGPPPGHALLFDIESEVQSRPYVAPKCLAPAVADPERVIWLTQG